MNYDKYNDHYEEMINNKRIAIISDENIRIGFSYLKKDKNNRLNIFFVIKPNYCLNKAEEFMIQACNFFSRITDEKIFIKLISDNSLMKLLLEKK